MAKSRKSSSRKSKKSVKTFLHSKLVLYLSLILFIFNILAFLFFKDMQSLFLLLIILCITYMFDQNMILVLMVPMLFVGTLIILRKTFMDRDLVEGMEDGQGSMKKKEGNNNKKQGSSNQQEDTDSKQEENDNEQQGSDEEGTSNKQKESGSQKGKLPMPVNCEEQEDHPYCLNGGDGSPPDSNSNKNTETYSNINSSNTENLKSELNNLVSKYEKVQKEFNDSVENSSLDPQSLEAQKAVVKQMNALTPLIKDSVGILNKVDLNGLNKFIGSFGNLIGSVSTPQPVSSSTKV